MVMVCRRDRCWCLPPLLPVSPSGMLCENETIEITKVGKGERETGRYVRVVHILLPNDNNKKILLFFLHKVLCINLHKVYGKLIIGIRLYSFFF